jgi:hypothetical protein
MSNRNQAGLSLTLLQIRLLVPMPLARLSPHLRVITARSSGFEHLRDLDRAPLAAARCWDAAFAKDPAPCLACPFRRCG